MAAQGNDICSTEPESRFGNTTIYQTQNSSSIQNAIGGLFTDIIAFVQRKEFQTCIEEDDEWINGLVIELCDRKQDLCNAECAIVVSGETSSGKTSVINLIIGEDLLPVDIEANTTRLCRIKNSAERSISTLKAKDHILNTWTFQTEDEMAKKLDGLAETTDHEIKYVDIFLPVQMLKGNITIVDTPGIGDIGQKEFVNLTMEYIPNALAFIFVVNVVNAGGLQDDRLPIIFKQIRESMESMYSHSPEDAIFLLNKWDTLVLKRQKTDFFEKTKKKLCHLWPEAKTDYIIKFAAARVAENDDFRQQFEKFQNILQEVIERNVNKMMFVHLRYLGDFLKRREDKFLTSKERVKKMQDKIMKGREKASNQITAIKRATAKLSDNLEQTIEDFRSAVIGRYLNHITDINYKQTIFANIEPFTRFTLEKELKRRILLEYRTWWKGNVANIFKSTVMMSFVETLQKVDLHFDLSLINEKIEGLDDLINVKSTLWSDIKSSLVPVGGGVAGGLALSRVVVFPFAISGLATAGLVAGMLVQGAMKYIVLSPCQSVCEEMFKNIIENIKAEDMEQIFHERFAKQIKNFLSVFLKSVDKKVSDLNAGLEKLKSEHESCSRKSSVLKFLQSTIVQYKLRIKEIENFESSIE